MKRFVCKVVLFLVGLFVIDFILGLGARYLISHAKGGDTGLNNYICHQMREDCLVFGSSRGMHHYDPHVIEDSLKLSCWNCAKDGNGIIMMYGRYTMISARYTPKILIYDVQASYDLVPWDNHQFLGGLRYDYDEPSIDSIFWSVDKTERYKMLLNGYRYNSKWLQLISDNVHPLLSDDKGYRPVDKKMVYKPKRGEAKRESYHYDSLKLFYMEKLIKSCQAKGTKLIFAISPQFGMFDDEVYEPLKELCAKYRVPLVNHYCDKEFVTMSDYFYDSSHMNRTGATKYTKKVVGEIRGIIK